MKETITKSITIVKRPADFQNVHVTYGITREIEFENEEERKIKTQQLSDEVFNEVMNETTRCYEAFWGMTKKTGKTGKKVND